MAQQNGNSVPFLTSIGRLVQGGFEPQTKDSKGQPLTIKTGPNAGQATQRYFLAVAFDKNDPAWGAFWAQVYEVGRAGYPALFDPATGQCKHPRFAFKVMDGDGSDNDGKPNSSKPGFAGHWVVKFSSTFAPRAFYQGKYDPAQQIQNPAEVIKRGYFVRVSGTMAPNIGSDVPGVYINADMVELCGRGEEIVSGPSASDTFGAAPAPAYRPAGMVDLGQIPYAGAGGAQPGGMPMPGATPTPATGGMPMPGAAAPAMGNGMPMPGAGAGAPMPGASSVPASAPAPTMGMPMPGQGATLPPANNGFVANAGMPMPGAAAPVRQLQMTAAAQGYSREQYHANGVTDEQLVANGYAVWA